MSVAASGRASEPPSPVSAAEQPLSPWASLLSPRPEAAWGLAGLGFLVTLVSTGMRFAVGPFLTSLADDFGFSVAGLSAVVAAAFFLFGAGLPFAGRLADEWGAKAVLVCGYILLAASLAISAFTRSQAVFIVAFAGLASLGFAATSQVVFSSLISRWFRRRRALAMMFLSAGGMAGIAVLTPVSALLVAQVGWRTAYTLVAAFVVAVLLPLTLLLMGRVPSGPGSSPAAAAPPDGTPKGDQSQGDVKAAVSWREAAGTPSFWTLATGFFACGFSMHLLGAHGVPMLEHHGFHPVTAAMGIGLIGIVAIFSTVLLGIAADALGRPLVLSLIYFVRGLGFLGLLAVGREWELFAVAAAGGLVWAGSTALTSAITADLFGVRSVGTLFGTLFLIHQVGGAAASYVGGWGFEALGSYTVPFSAAALLLFIGSLLCFRLPRPVPHSLPARS